MKVGNYLIYQILVFLFFSCGTQESKPEQKISVPNLVGITLDEARSKYPNLKLNVLSYDSSTVYGRDTILSQSPEPGAQITAKEMVNINVSAGVIPPAQLLRFDGRIDSVKLKSDGIQFNVTGWVYNPNNYIVKLNYFYYYTCDLTGKKYDYRQLNIPDIASWIQPRQTIRRSYEYFLSYDKIQIPLDRIVIRVVAGCVYDTHEGQRRTVRVIGEQEVVRSLIPGK